MAIGGTEAALFINAFVPECECGIDQKLKKYGILIKFMTPPCLPHMLDQIGDKKSLKTKKFDRKKMVPASFSMMWLRIAIGRYVGRGESQTFRE